MTALLATIEARSARPITRRATTALDLIHTVDGIETPARGAWLIKPNHPVQFAYGALIPRPVGAATVTGALHVDHDPAAAAFALTLRARRPAGSTRDSEFTLDYRSTSIEFDWLGTWRVRGFLTHETRRTETDAILRYHGVYRNHDRFVAWLSFHLRGTLHRGRVATGRSLLARRIRIDAQINAEPSAELLDASVRR